MRLQATILTGTPSLDDLSFFRSLAARNLRVRLTQSNGDNGTIVGPLVKYGNGGGPCSAMTDRARLPNSYLNSNFNHSFGVVADGSSPDYGYYCFSTFGGHRVELEVLDEVPDDIAHALLDTSSWFELTPS